MLRETRQEKVLQTLPNGINQISTTAWSVAYATESSVRTNSKWKKTEGRQHLALVPSTRRKGKASSNYVKGPEEMEL